MNDYIVYVARYKQDVMYVGQGKPDRYKHLTSGKSHCIEANRHFFSGLGLNVDILHSGLTKEESFKIEQQLIKELRPLWNNGSKIMRLDPEHVASLKFAADLRLSSLKSGELAMALFNFVLARMDSKGEYVVKSSVLYNASGKKFSPSYLRGLSKKESYLSQKLAELLFIREEEGYIHFNLSYDSLELETKGAVKRWGRERGIHE